MLRSQEEEEVKAITLRTTTQQKNADYDHDTVQNPQKIEENAIHRVHLGSESLEIQVFRLRSGLRSCEISH